MESTAQEKKGLILIKTREENGWINVCITDNGSGISGENVNKMFDPFFTTKGLGKGTGLGLSIVSGIVKKHKGDITVESIPGQTTFTVSLPLDNENGGGFNGE
jgi:signal transduction histidine kinase